MTWEIVFMLLLLGTALTLFVWEKFPPDVTALFLFVVIILAGMLPEAKALSVLSNPAPLTVGAMFILSSALVKCGAIDNLAGLLQRLAGMSYFTVMLVLIVTVALLSAFVNNTPIVVVFVPVVLGMARKMASPPSKWLIPLSYAAILGGTCTLMGTSTNLVVAGIVLDRGLPPISMFELASVGVPILIAGTLYIAIFGRYLLPKREMFSSVLSEEERREYITEAFVPADSPVIGKTLQEAGLISQRGIRVLELVRDEVAVPFVLKQTCLAPGDRIVMACHPKGIAQARALPGFNLEAEMNVGLEQISTHEGAIVEGVVSPNSGLIGRTIAESDFRQHYRVVVLAVHRSGRNLREKIDTMTLRFGDILLLMGTDNAIESLRGNENLMLIDRPPVPSQVRPWQLPVVLGSIAGVVLASSFNILPIHIAAIVACLVLFLTGCLKPKDGYRAVEWNLLILIYGMLAVGLAMEETGTTAYLVDRLLFSVQHIVPEVHQPMVMLAVFFFVTSVLTEILSNNAVAALMAPLAIGLAAQLGLDSRPFIVAVCVAASASFATPIGYQTNTYVYGVGGYRFADFMRFGLPMNVISFGVFMYLAPLFWPL